MNEPATSPPAPVALIVPLGGSPDAVVKALEVVTPTHVAFFVSPQTRGAIEGVRAKLPRQPDYVRIIETPDAESLEKSFAELRRHLPGVLREWRLSWDQVTVDITGGTKPMVAALTLATIHQATSYLYIGGERRNKDGVGVVETGSEKPISSTNPWSLLAIDSLRQFEWAFNHFQFAAAAEAAQRCQGKTSQREVRRYRALEQLALAYEAWERFDYTPALDQLKKQLDLLTLMWTGDPRLVPLLATLENNLRVLEELKSAARAQAPSWPLLRDLLANALRRGLEHRYDDAVARLYRFIEGAAQARLWDSFHIATGRVLLNDLPDTPEWQSSRADAEHYGYTKIPLEKSWLLLQAKGEPIAHRADALLAQTGALHRALQSRNNSLLAHGTRPVNQKDFDLLYAQALELSGPTEDQLVRFPVFPEE